MLVGKGKVQNFELYAIFEKYFKNKRFITKRSQRLIIMNPITQPRAVKRDL